MILPVYEPTPGMILGIARIQRTARMYLHCPNDCAKYSPKTVLAYTSVKSAILKLATRNQRVAHNTISAKGVSLHLIRCVFTFHRIDKLLSDPYAGLHEDYRADLETARNSVFSDIVTMGAAEELKGFSEEVAIYQAQGREDARADIEKRAPKLIATLFDIEDM